MKNSKTENFNRIKKTSLVSLIFFILLLFFIFLTAQADLENIKKIDDKETDISKEFGLKEGSVIVSNSMINTAKKIIVTPNKGKITFNFMNRYS